MNSDSSRIIAFILFALLLVVGFFSFNQFNTLNDTQAELQSAESANADLSERVDSLAAANTQSADDLASANESAAQALADAQATATESAAIASENQQNVEQTATQSAQEAADAIAAIESTAAANSDAAATEIAEGINALMTLEAEATENVTALSDVSSSATDAALELETLSTQQSVAAADAQGTVDAIALLVTESASMNATLQADNAALATSIAQAETMEQEAEPVSNTSSEVPDGMVLFKGLDFQILLPDDFIAFDLRLDLDEAIDTFADLGDEYVIYQDTVDFAGEDDLLVGVADEPNKEGFADGIVLYREPVSFYDISTFDAFLEDYATNYLEEEIVDISTIELNGEDVGRIELQTPPDDIFEARALVYLYIIDDNVYTIIHISSADEYANREKAYDLSGQSFTVTGE